MPFYHELKEEQELPHLNLQHSDTPIPDPCLVLFRSVALNKCSAETPILLPRP